MHRHSVKPLISWGMKNGLRGEPIVGRMCLAKKNPPTCTSASPNYPAALNAADSHDTESAG
jgi:hypothetical protein